MAKRKKNIRKIDGTREYKILPIYKNRSKFSLKSIFKRKLAFDEDDLEDFEFTDSIHSIDFTRHGRSYSNLLKVYVDSAYRTTRLKNGLKVLFFLITMGSLVAVVYFFYISLKFVFSTVSELESITDISLEAILGILTIIVPSITSLITAFINIPEIIARYLFNTKEDENMNTIIKNIQDYDKDIFAMENKINEAFLSEKAKQENSIQEEDIEIQELPKPPKSVEL